MSELELELAANRGYHELQRNNLCSIFEEGSPEARIQHLDAYVVLSAARNARTRPTWKSSNHNTKGSISTGLENVKLFIRSQGSTEPKGPDGAPGLTRQKLYRKLFICSIITVNSWIKINRVLIYT